MFISILYDGFYALFNIPLPPFISTTTTTPLPLYNHHLLFLPQSVPNHHYLFSSVPSLVLTFTTISYHRRLSTSTVDKWEMKSVGWKIDQRQFLSPTEPNLSSTRLEYSHSIKSEKLRRNGEFHPIRFLFYLFSRYICRLYVPLRECVFERAKKKKLNLDISNLNRFRDIIWGSNLFPSWSTIWRSDELWNIHILLPSLEDEFQSR